MAVTYKFSTGVPNITPAVYAAGDVGGDDLNTEETVTDSSGVLSLDLDVGDYVAQWRWEGDTHTTAGDVTEVDADTWRTSSGPSSPLPAVTGGVTSDQDNTYSGTGTFVRFDTPDGEDVVLALGEAGQDFPSFVLLSDGEMFFGDGSADPLLLGTGQVAVASGKLAIGYQDPSQVIFGFDDTTAQLGANTLQLAIEALTARVAALEGP